MSRVRNFVIYGLPIGTSDDAPPTPPEDQELFYNDSAETDIFYNDSAQTDPFTTPAPAPAPAPAPDPAPDPALGPLTTAYSAAIAANGGTISPDKEALIDDFFYSEYANASSGVGTVASFISAFNTANAIIHPFFGDNLAAALVPAVGHGLAPLVNTGFTVASYLPTLGLRGNGTAYATTNINLTALTTNNITVMTAVRLNGPSQAWLFSFVSSNNQIRAATIANGDYYIRIRSNSGTTISAPPTELIATINSSTIEQRIYQGLTSSSTSTAVTLPFQSTSLRVGNNSGSFTGEFIVLAIANRLLTNDERTILHNATAAFVAARKLI